MVLPWAMATRLSEEEDWHWEAVMGSVMDLAMGQGPQASNSCPR